MRYSRILELVAFHKPRCIVEVGTWNGLRAIEMATEALKHQPRVHYIGFDLFEDGNDEIDKVELNVKARSTLAEVKERLDRFAAQNPGFSYALHKGNTRQLFKDIEFTSDVDLAFIDGGHSVETIRNDYEALKAAKVIVFDDYYSPDDQGRMPDITKYGCNKVVENIERLIVPDKDPVKDGGFVSLVVTPIAACPWKQRLQVKTQNCVQDKNIQANILYSTKLIDRWIPQCRIHDRTAVVCSGGPSLSSHIDDIRSLARKDGTHVVCVKHSHDLLIESGVVPWACMLLDPRGHVKDFIENPHHEVIYFVASMCHPTTVDRLLEKNAKIFGYHAFVGAGENMVLKKGDAMIAGGSTSAVRGISVLHSLGFRRFVLYGFDSCYWEKPDVSAKDKMGRPKYMEVEVAGRKFWTDAELVAQCQDFEQLMKIQDQFDMDIRGDGMIPHVWALTHKPKVDFGDFFAPPEKPREDSGETFARPFVFKN